MTTKTPKAEQAIAEQFTTWAGAVDQADVATVTLSIALINSSVSTRKASEIAVDLSRPDDAERLSGLDEGSHQCRPVDRASLGIVHRPPRRRCRDRR